MFTNRTVQIPKHSTPPLDLKRRIEDALGGFHRRGPVFSRDPAQTVRPSAVLFLLGPHRKTMDDPAEPCLILNKRSARVKQPGDLCCPGGAISALQDPLLAKLLRLPGSPLSRWPYWPHWRSRRRAEADHLAVLFAGALREGFEEMRLNPLGVDFLGPLPVQQLAMFRRQIYPMACWVSRQKNFFPNWEVEKLVYIPLKELLTPAHYARCRMQSEVPRAVWNHQTAKDFSCFVHEDSERLWGATFRITMAFLKLVFDFQPPAPDSLPLVHDALGKNYATGNR